MNVADALSGRMGLPGVQWLLLAAAPRKRLGQELAALLPDGGQVAQCRILRASFKPGRRLTAWCDVELRGITGRAAGNMRRPIAVTWAADFERERQGAGGGADEMVAEALRRGVCAPFRQLLAEIPDWGMRILVSPLDTQFPQLVRLSDPEYIRQMLASVDGDGSTLL